MAEEKKPLFVFRGKFYRSFSEACVDFGIEPAQAYRFRRKTGMASADVLEHCLQYREENGGIRRLESRQTRDIWINGHRFNSYTEAINWYNIPRVSVTSRVRRYNISFQTALTELIMKKYDLHINSLKNTPANATSPDIRPLSANHSKFYELLKKEFPHIELIQSSPVSGFKIPYPSEKDPVFFCYLYLGLNFASMCVPELISVPESMDLFSRLNAFNCSSFLPVLGYKDGYVSASWLIDSAEYFSKRLLQLICVFLSSCQEFLSSWEHSTPPPISIPPLSHTEKPLTDEQKKALAALKESVQAVSYSQTRDHLIFSYPYPFSSEKEVECHSLYGESSHWMLIPDLIDNVSESLEGYRILLEFQTEFSGCRFWFHDGKIGASWNEAKCIQDFFSKSCRMPLSRFLNTCHFFSMRWNENKEKKSET